MKVILIICLLAIGFNGLSQADTSSTREFEIQEGDTTYIMKQYVMVFLKSGEKRAQNEAEAADIQAGHMAHINQLAEDGYVVMAGPFGDDSEYRGILLFDVATVEEAIQLESNDPAVKAGRLVIEAHPWWGAKGTILK